uniref:GPI anchored protein n=1 Tax=Plectus sambesii TaxID=2011161 RepID=A0A914VFS2_9BILA
MTGRVRSILLLISCLVVSIQSENCHFAQNYNLNQLLNDAAAQDSFLMSASYWEGKFATDRIGINYASGLTYDGTSIDYTTGLPHPGGLHEFSAASKEAVHVSLLALAIEGKSKYAVNFFQSSMQAVHWNGTVQEYVIDQLTRKIGSYEQFNQQYPGFGGFLPWYALNDSGVQLLNGWASKVPALDNGELIWGLIAVVQVLTENGGYPTLLGRYTRQVTKMARNGLTIFYDGAGSGTVRCVAQIRNVDILPTRSNYYRDGECVLNDPYEGELFVFFVDFFSDWTNYAPGDKDKVWQNKRPQLQPATLHSSFGPITVERGWMHSSHEKWKYMELPYFDIPINNAVFLNGERARSQFSFTNSYPGLFASAANVSQPGNYNPNYISATGIQEIASAHVDTNALVTPYGAYPLLLHPTTRPYGIVWYASMLQGSKMQGPQGSTESVSIQGDLISPINTWDTKITSVLAFSGGIIDITRRYIQQTGHYIRFATVVATEWGRVFGEDNLSGSNIAFALPKASVPQKLPMFTGCTSKK